MNEKLYDYNQVMEAINKIRNFNITCTRKIYHKTLCYEFKKIIENDLMPINDWLYNTEMYSFYAYYQLAEKLYDTTTKKEMDKALNYLKVSILNDLYKTLQLAS